MFYRPSSDKRADSSDVWSLGTGRNLKLFLAEEKGGTDCLFCS